MSRRLNLSFTGLGKRYPFNQDVTETRQPMGSAALKNFRFAKGIAGV
jgi:hypothetical protein